jgi:hypothetical protein
MPCRPAVPPATHHRRGAGRFLRHSLADYDLVYAFLSPVPMTEVWHKASTELRPGALLVSNSFPIEGVEPEQVIEVDDRRHTRLYCYRPAGPPTCKNPELPADSPQFRPPLPL